jgi:phosphoribosylglycinamide formyltransferase-1
MKRIVVLFSGEGTNLENIAKRLAGRVKITKAITNNPAAGGIRRAQRLGIPVEVIDHREFASREAFDARLVEAIEEARPDLVVLAGFMRILTPLFTRRIRAVNIHPSLLPLFKGARAIERSFKSDMKVAGVTIHWVTEELDSGAIIEQGCFHKDDEDLATFTQKIHELEYRLYPAVIENILYGDQAFDSSENLE